LAEVSYQFTISFVSFDPRKLTHRKTLYSSWIYHANFKIIIIKVLSQFGRVTHFDIVVNLARDEAHGKDVFKRFKGIVDRFLTANLYHAATIPEDEHLLASINNCVPPIISAPDSKAAHALEGLSNMIAGPQATPINEDDDMFFSRGGIVPQGAIQ
jgi:MinD-like ATPase involved in chromosome partitioning or flagellar assembly